MNERRLQIAARALLAVLAGLFVVLVVTGIFLTFHYRPDIVGLGGASHRSTLRVAHRVASWCFVGGLVLYAVVASIRFSGALRVAFALAALALALFGAHTGYLLPWDQLAVRAVTVGTNIEGYSPILHGNNVKSVLIGNTEVTPSTLSRSYWAHSVVVPVLLIVVAGVGVWFSRRRSRTAAPSAAPEPA